MSARGAAAGLALPGRVHPAALLIAVLLHLLAIALLLRAGHVAPPPMTVSLSLAMPPSSVAETSARPAEALQPVATPPPAVPAAPPPPPVAASAPPEPLLSSPSPTSPPAPPPPALAPASPPVPLAPAPPPRPIRAEPPPPAPPPALPLPPPPPPVRFTPSPIPRPAPIAPHPSPPPARPLARRAPAPAPGAGARASPASRPTAGPGAPAPAAPSSSWIRAVSAWLDAHKSYPALAQQRDEQGTVVLRFTVTRSGRVLAVAVLRGSGSDILDRAAEGLLRGATLPPLPATMQGAETTVTFAIRYMLEP
ncbi:MAG TPA: energy transducer TonB [Acetobacteraceae bacterium]|nr:energy transducer TonB [Acetobacteraceae bacterium]